MWNAQYADVAVMTSQFDTDGVEKLVISCFPRLKDGNEFNSGLHEFTRAVVLTCNTYSLEDALQAQDNISRDH